MLRVYWMKKLHVSGIVVARSMVTEISPLSTLWSKGKIGMGGDKAGEQGCMPSSYYACLYQVTFVFMVFYITIA